MILLDTDHVSELQWGSQLGAKVQARLDALELGRAYPATIISYEEQMRAWISHMGMAKTLNEEVGLYYKLRHTLPFTRRCRYSISQKEQQQNYSG